MKPMILAGALLLAAVPVLAASPASPAPYTVTAAFVESAATEYLNDAGSQYNDWSQKMANLDMGIVNKTITMNAKAKTDLDTVWDTLKVRWTELKTAKAEDWDSARTSWAKASEEMRDSWQHLVPQQG